MSEWSMYEKRKCVECGKEFTVANSKNPPVTCSKACEANLKYRKKTKSLKGDMKSSDEVRKWKK